LHRRQVGHHRAQRLLVHVEAHTGLGFEFPGSTITAESWCQDQPAALVLREIDLNST
jgi:hypothetical protein